MTEAEWFASTDPMAMLELLRGKASERKLRLFTVSCCRAVWPRLIDKRIRKVVEVVEHHVEGLATNDQLQTASIEAERVFQWLREQVLASIVGVDLARQAIGLPRGLFDITDLQTARSAHNSADNDPAVLAASAVWSTASLESELQAARYSRLDIAIGVANQASDTALRPEAEKNLQASLLRDILGNSFHPITIKADWLTTTVANFATVAYKKRAMPSGQLDTIGLAVLADALEDEGCDNQDILSHLRSPGPHVRGCFALDLLLGKE